MQKDPNQTPAKANSVGSGQNPPKRTLQNAAAGTAKPTVPKKTGAAAGQSRPSAPIPQKNGPENMINVRRTLHRGGRSTIGYTQRAVVKIGKGIKKGVDIGVSGFNQYVETGETKSGFTARFTHFFRHITFSLFLTVFAVILLIALMLFSNTNIVVDEQKVTIPGASSDFEGFSILHLSDLHARTFGENQEALLRAIDNLDYDIVVITGDMVGATGNADPFWTLLDGLGTSRPVYFIAGDSDPGPLLSSTRDIVGTLNEMVLEEWILGAMRRGATYLNKPISIEVGSSTLWLSPASMLNVNADTALEMAEYELDLQKGGVVDGIFADYTELPFTNYRYRQMSGLKEGALYLEDEDLHITLSHYPPSENALAAAQVNASEVENAYLHAPDLALCGHYCGGVWRLPFIGAFYIPDSLAENHGWLPDQEMVSGLRQSSSTTIYTSAGLGVTDYGFFLDFRVMNSPQISLITLTTQLTDDLLAR